jgi:hypothetical protein
MSINLVGSESRSTISLSQGRSVVGAVTRHGDQPSAALRFPDQRQFVLGRRFGQEIVDAGLSRDHAGRDRIVAGHHHGPDTHPTQLVEPVAHAGLEHVGELDHAENPGGLAGFDADGQRRAALCGDVLDDLTRTPGFGAARLQRP